MQTVQFAGSPNDIPFLRLPETSALFTQRARRLQQLAPGHPLESYLTFIGKVAEAQQAVLATLPAPALPDAAQLALAREHGLPPLSVYSLPRSTLWQDALRGIIDHIAPALDNAQSRNIVARLNRSSSEELEQEAQQLLTANLEAIDPGTTPLIAAALQVYWAAMLAQLQPTDFRRLESLALCPACGSHPVASVVRIGATEQGLRYLSCALCATEWHMPRIQCVGCGSSKEIAYYDIEGAGGAVQAETCDACHGYLKIMHQEKDTGLEACADDLATLPLDILMGDAGYGRYGFNPFLLTQPAPVIPD